MFWIVETLEQLNKLEQTVSERLMIHIIPNNDMYHFSFSEAIAFIIYDIKTKELYILPISHSESLNELDIPTILNFIYNKKELCFFNIKSILKYISNAKNCYSIWYYLNADEVINDKKYNTIIHNNFYNLYKDKDNINSIIPLTKHYEKWYSIFSTINFEKVDFSGKTQDFYENLLISNFYNIENQGIKINEKLFENTFDVKNKNASLLNGKIYYEYNFFHTTSRPSNNFNGLNIMSLKKNSTERECFIPENDFFIELDYNAYHPRIISNLIGHDIPSNDFYEDIISETGMDRSRVKKIVFTALYKVINDDFINQIEFIKKAVEFRRFLWNRYQEKKFIKSPVSGRRIYNIEKEDNILPLLCQTLETEYNALSIRKILNLLDGKKSKLVLYGYDSFLFDYSKKDGKKLLLEIKSILENNDFGYYPINIKMGDNYNNLQTVE